MALRSILSSDLVEDVVAVGYGAFNGYLLDKQAGGFILVNLAALIASIVVEEVPKSIRYASENNLGIILYAMFTARR